MGKTFGIVQRVAYLEGWKDFVFNTDNLDATLQNLDVRIVALEKIFKIHAPPPTLQPDWESLDFRTRRLYRKPGYSRALQVSSIGQDPADEKVDATLLKSTLLRLGIGSPGKVLPDDPVDFNAASQELCYLAGRNNVKISYVIEDTQKLYETAVDLFLHLESMPPHMVVDVKGRPPVPHGGMPMGPRMPPGMGPGQKPKKGCCGCCSCHCHTPIPVVSAPPHSFRRRRPRVLRFGWLRRLFGMKTKVYDSDSNSSSASTLSVSSGTSDELMR